ncbi:MAG: hypothetical protein ACKVU1_16190 [bacterium]
MKALAFWKAVVADEADFLGSLIAELKKLNVRFCVVGGQAVNAYVEPLVSLDLDLAVSTMQIDDLDAQLRHRFTVERFAHSVNVSSPGSDLRVQFQTDSRYSDFVDRATVREVLGVRLPVAALEDVLQGKVWAALDSTRRASKRQKDFADIARILESQPSLRDRVPQEILSRLV